MTIRKQILALGGIAVAFTLILSGVLFVQSSQKARTLSHFGKVAELLISLSELADSMTNESNTSWNAWTANGEPTEATRLFQEATQRSDSIIARIETLETTLRGGGALGSSSAVPIDIASLKARLDGYRAKVAGPQRAENNWPTTQEYQKEIVAVVGSIPTLSRQTTNGDLLRRMIVISTLVGFKLDYTIQAGSTLYWLENKAVNSDALSMSSAFLATTKERILLLDTFSAESVHEVVVARVNNADLNRFLSVVSDVVASGRSNDPQQLDYSSDYHGALASAVKSLDAGIDETIRFAADDIQQFTKDEIAQARGAQWRSLLVGSGCLIACGFLGFLFANRITSTVTNVSVELNREAAKGLEFAKMFAKSSEGLASGGARQASAIEQVSSSMIEMESTSKLNLESLERVLQLGASATNAAERGEAEMRELTAAMAEMSDSSRQISEIAKTIEEIAFQTNILALNAAVEAARAGEAGAGFAVVADEVRSLAQKSAVSATSTRERINEAIRRIDAGEAMSEAVQARLVEIRQSAQSLRSEIGEVSTASRQQTIAMEQMSRAISEIDSVTQENAAESEEMAGTATLMRQSSQDMLRKTERLERLCGIDVGKPQAKPLESDAFSAPKRVRSVGVKVGR